MAVVLVETALQDRLRLSRGPNGDVVQLVEARCLGATCAMRSSRKRSSARESTLLKLLDSKLLEEEEAVGIGPVLREHAVGDTQRIGPGAQTWLRGDDGGRVYRGLAGVGETPRRVRVPNAS